MEFSAIRDQFTSLGYRHILKPLFFLQDPEKVHDRMTALGELLGSSELGKGLVKALFGYRHQSLVQEICGIRFDNPVGLAAGFDKDARLTEILPAVGFGFAEVGSFTAEAYPGNPSPRLYRLPERGSLRVNYGLKNQGADQIRKKLAHSGPRAFPLGMSIAKTNSPKTASLETGLEDYAYSYSRLAAVGSYVTINISCPNTCEERPLFADPGPLKLLLERLFDMPKPCPVFIKLSPDLDSGQLRQLMEVCGAFPVDGFVCGNLTKKNPFGHLGKGGFSGRVLGPMSDRLISETYHYFGGRRVIIGCGGIFSAADAYRKIRLGASLIQLITGMIFQGPQLVGQINRGLSELLRRDGYSSIGQAVGQDVDKGRIHGAI